MVLLKFFVFVLSIGCALAQSGSTTLSESDVNETTSALSTTTIPSADNSTVSQNVSATTAQPSATSTLPTDAVSVLTNATDRSFDDVTDVSLIGTNTTVTTTTQRSPSNHFHSTTTTTTRAPFPPRRKNHRHSSESHENRHSDKSSNSIDDSNKYNVEIIETPFGPVFVIFDLKSTHKNNDKEDPIKPNVNNRGTQSIYSGQNYPNSRSLANNGGYNWPQYINNAFNSYGQPYQGYSANNYAPQNSQPVPRNINLFDALRGW